jgi:PmbA protein
MKAQNLLQIAEELVAFGQKNGASQVEVSINQGTNFSVDILQGNIDKLTEAVSKGLGLRVFVDGKVAKASSSDFSNETLHRLMLNAIVRAKLSSPDPLAGLPVKDSPTVDTASLRIYDPAVAEMAPEKKIAAAKETEAVCLADQRIKKTFGSSFSTHIGERFLANSNGFSSSFQRTSCSCGVSLQAGEDPNLFDEGWYDSSVNLLGLESPEVIAKKAIHRVTRLIGGKKVESQNVPVVFEPPMTAEILNFFSTCIGGNNVYLKQSFLAGKIGEKVGNDFVTIIDDGLMPGAPGTEPFDGEGVPSCKTVVMEKGILKSYLLDTYAGRKLGMKSTGNSGGPNNLYFAAGEFTPEQIIKSIDNGLLLTGTIGFGQVPTTGDISRGAFGIWIEKGELTYPVAEITISGNLAQLLRGVQMVGNDLQIKDSVSGPTIKVAEMTVGGK